MKRVLLLWACFSTLTACGGADDAPSTTLRPRNSRSSNPSGSTSTPSGSPSANGAPSGNAANPSPATPTTPTTPATPTPPAPTGPIGVYADTDLGTMTCTLTTDFESIDVGDTTFDLSNGDCAGSSSGAACAIAAGCQQQIAGQGVAMSLRFQGTANGDPGTCTLGLGLDGGQALVQFSGNSLEDCRLENFCNGCR